MVKDGHTCRRGCARSGHRIALAPAWSNEIGVRFARLTWSLKTSRREWCPLTSNLRWDRCCGIDIDLRHRQALFLPHRTRMQSAQRSVDARVTGVLPFLGLREQLVAVGLRILHVYGLKAGGASDDPAAAFASGVLHGGKPSVASVTNG